MLTSTWRLWTGPLVTIMTGVAVLSVDRLLFPLPMPVPGAALLFCVLFAAYVGGVVPGVSGSALAITFMALHYSEPGQPFAIPPDKLARLAALGAIMVVSALLIGASQTRARKSLTRLEVANRDLITLRTALDQINDGVTLLDRELRVDFTNTIVRQVVPEFAASEKLPYADLMRHAHQALGYELAGEPLDTYIAKRVEWVRAGDSVPLDVRTRDGGVTRIKCTKLPSGGRIIVYSDITDLVHHADNLESANRELINLRTALDEVEEGVVLLDRDLRVNFMNKAIREIGGLRERAQDERPTYAELLQEVRSNRAYAVPEDQLDAYVAQRVEYVRSGNPNPVDLRMADGKVIRFKCNVLPDGGRMLIYADVTDLIRNAEQLEKLATTDGLTGLYNHRHFMKLADGEWNRFRRHGRQLSLLMFDIDFFKSFNDRFGHEFGDQVLFHIAALSREDRRETDIVARIGGEEFAVLLPETGIDAAAVVAERLRQEIEKSELQSDGKDLTVTVSIGVAEAQPGMRDIGDLLKDADDALYKAKRTGRNRVVRAARRPIVTLVSSAPLRSA